MIFGLQRDVLDLDKSSFLPQKDEEKFQLGFLEKVGKTFI